MTSRFTYRNREAYVDWLGLASHEFFHVWNVKRSRPVALGPFDYENEVYTRTLWVAEGVTAYYTDLMPCRAGVTTPEEFLKELSKMVSQVQKAPGRALCSLEQASFDAWIKLYRPDENLANTSISYYDKGGLVAWLLDVQIRERTGGKRSLDDLMRHLFTRYSGETGFTDEDVQGAAEEIAGASLDDFFRRHVRETVDPDYGPALRHLGLRFRPPGPGARPEPWLGVVAKAEEGRLLVKTVRRDGPAREAGLSPGDEILALGGYRASADTLAARLKQYTVGDRIEILVARREAVRAIPLTLGADPGDPWQLETDPEAPVEATRRRESWLTRS
jgi:predicted metalloprotease with PDZ domain